MIGKKNVIRIMLVSVLILAAFIFVNSSIHAQDQQGQSSVLSKLDQVLSSQKVLIDQVSAMRQELNIIKMILIRNRIVKTAIVVDKSILRCQAQEKHDELSVDPPEKIFRVWLNRRNIL